MSVINQMLRELDARGGGATDVLSAASRSAFSKPHANGRTVVLLLLLASAGGVAGYLALAGTPSENSQSVGVAPVPRAPAATPITVPIAAAPPAHDELPTVSEQAPATRTAIPPAAPEPTPVLGAAPKPVSIETIQMARSLSRARPAVATAAPPPRVASSDPLPLQAVPGVVKKIAESSPEAEAQQHFDDAQALRRAGQTEAAIVQYRQALERQPAMRNARIQLARLLQEDGQTDAALSLLKAGYERQPDAAWAIAVGRLLADQGQRDEALIWLQRGRDALRPADHALMGALLSQTQRHEAAVSADRHALTADPQQGGWLLGLGLALESLGQIDAAQAAYRNALERGAFKPEVVRFLRQKLGMSG